MVLGRPFLRSPEKGAATAVYLATSREVDGQSGGYYVDEAPVEPSVAARSKEDAVRLWNASAELAGLPK